MKKFKNIVISVSLDKRCPEELSELKDSDLLSNADNIYLVHIYNDKSKKYLSGNINANNFEEVEDYIVKKLHGLTDHLVPGHFNKNNQRHSYCLFNSSAKIKILDYLKEIGADLIIASTKGEQGIEGFFTDSYCYWLVEHAPCDVLVVRPKCGVRR